MYVHVEIRRRKHRAKNRTTDFDETEELLENDVELLEDVDQDDIVLVRISSKRSNHGSRRRHRSANHLEDSESGEGHEEGRYAHYQSGDF